MTEDELNAIEARLKATAPGEWQERFLSSRRGIYVEDGFIKNIFSWVGGKAKHNASFITQAHNHDIPVLIAEVRRLQEKLAGCEAEIEGGWDW